MLPVGSIVYEGWVEEQKSAGIRRVKRSGTLGLVRRDGDIRGKAVS
jgi:hypothetical protein